MNATVNFQHGPWINLAPFWYDYAYISGTPFLVGLPAAPNPRGRTPHLGATSTFHVLEVRSDANRIVAIVADQALP